jgi:hypothetical protein
MVQILHGSATTTLGAENQGGRETPAGRQPRPSGKADPGTNQGGEKPPVGAFMKKPHWECRNSVERAYFAEWTKAKLDEEWEQAWENADLHDLYLQDDEIQALESLTARRTRLRAIEQIVKRLAHGRRRNAIERDKNIDALVKLTDDRQLRRFAFQQFHPGSGRHKGQRRHVSEHSDTELLQLEEASAVVERIYRLWQREFKRRNCTISPTATAIAADLWSITEEELIKFRKG